MPSESVNEAILSLQQVSKRFGAQWIVKSASLTVHAGDRIGLIGRNGSGKSTLLRIIAELDTPEDGFVTRKQGLRVAMLGQQCVLGDDQTVGEALQAATATIQEKLDKHNRLSLELAENPTAETEAAWQQLHHELDIADAWNLNHQVKKTAIELALPSEDRTVGSLSGGERRRLDLAVTLLQQPDLLLLDEPTNHIDVASVQWLENYLAGYRGSCILVTHDRYFLENVVTRIVELADKTLYTFPGNYETYLELKSIREEQEARNEASRASTMRRELAWLKRGPKARGTKQKARIQRFESLSEERAPERDRRFAFAIPEPPRLGKRILEAENITRWIGGRPLFQDLSFIMQQDMRLGLIGPNGCGKTTLLRVLMGLEEPDEGRVYRGESVEFLYVDQSHEEVDPTKTILQYVSNNVETITVNGRPVYVPSYLERFLFDRSTVRMPMENLSGGERNRIDLARKLLQGGNILVLDEPTNDLDLYTLRVLEEAVINFEGCSIVVSHDRYFLNRVCTHLLVFEGNGHVIQITGNYDDYLIYAKGRESKPPRDMDRKTEQSARQRSEASRVRKLTWNEKREFETIEDRIHEAEERLRFLEEQVSDPAFYQQDRDTIAETLEQLEETRTEVEQLYDRWSELDAIQAGHAS